MRAMTIFLSDNVTPNAIKPLTKACRLANLAIATGCMMLTGHAFAAAMPPSSNLSTPEVTFDPLIVTAVKTPTLASNTIAQTTVIDQDALQRYQGQSALDVLRSQAGISIAQNGGDGTLNNIYLRGFENKQILVLIDGIRYSSVSAGGAALSLLPADQIERIEVLYGASGASLYGADAMGGVIQVFTKGQSATQSNVSVTLGAGSENSHKTQVAGQWVTQNSTLSLAAGHQQTDGIDATLPSAAFNIHHPDTDGFKSNHYSVVAKHTLNEQLDVGLTGLYADSTTDFDSSAFDMTTFTSTPYQPTYAEQKNGAASAFANYQHDKFSAQVKYGQSFDKSTTYDGSSPNGGRFDTTQQQANVQLGYRLPVGQVLGGVEWLKQHLDSTIQYNKIADRTVNSGFIGYQLNQPKYDMQAHVRHDDNSAYGNQTSYNLGAAYRVLPSTRIGASYATGFRAPTFNDIQYGVDNLKPETSKNSELFIENRTANQSTRLTGFMSKVNDKIIINPDNNYLSQNVDKVDIKGATLTTDWQFGYLTTGASYTHQSVKNATGRNEDKFLKYVPKDQGNWYIGYSQPKYDIRAEVEHIGKRFSNDANTQSLDDYTLLNLSGNYYVTPHLTLNSRINNLTDTRYQTAEGYRQKGINSFVSLTYQWF